MPVSTYPVLFESQFLTASNAAIYNVPSTTNTVLRGLSLQFNNVTTATRLITIYASTDGAEDTSNAIAFNHPVPPNDWIVISVPRVGAGGVIEGFCDLANAVNVCAYEDSGRLYVP